MPAAVLAINDLGRFLRDRWTLTRQTVDHTTSTVTHFTGWATFSTETSDQSRLRYEETGTHASAGRALDATRRYLYALETPSRARVFFENGNPFHDLDLSAGSWTCEHVCGDDIYRGTFTVQSDDSWTIRWVVEGPNKHLTITSRLER